MVPTHLAGPKPRDTCGSDLREGKQGCGPRRSGGWWSPTAPASGPPGAQALGCLQHSGARGCTTSTGSKDISSQALCESCWRQVLPWREGPQGRGGVLRGSVEAWAPGAGYMQMKLGAGELSPMWSQAPTHVGLSPPRPQQGGRTPPPEQARAGLRHQTALWAGRSGVQMPRPWGAATWGGARHGRTHPCSRWHDPQRQCRWGA